jgi:hypothetical protein
VTKLIKYNGIHKCIYYTLSCIHDFGRGQTNAPRNSSATISDKQLKDIYSATCLLQACSRMLSLFSFGHNFLLVAFNSTRFLKSGIDLICVHSCDDRDRSIFRVQFLSSAYRIVANLQRCRIFRLLFKMKHMRPGEKLGQKVVGVKTNK